uniref:NADH dehydrogenase subunit 3 n=1 Tax=Pillucina pisidium (Dunker, 1860) TaxID=244488 RepID=UPI00233F3957|nr:NADH dehydrogenase subunit 3 [Pillucina pisidium (Dunker, 1860)]WBR65413.1 NADH dehydrogenase subunit 3 [Pillucina pisidium (Dunker, 1860)]
MLFVLLGFCFCVIMCGVFILLSMMISKFVLKDREKGSPYECGFEPMGPTRVPFSLRFFLVAVIFLVFDLEVVLLFPCLMVGWNVWMFSFMLWMFLFLLGLGLGYEWNEGSLDWKE